MDTQNTGMITERYVPFELAKLLKEKGFNEHCREHYYENGVVMVMLCTLFIMVICVFIKAICDKDNDY